MLIAGIFLCKNLKFHGYFRPLISQYADIVCNFCTFYVISFLYYDNFVKQCTFHKRNTVNILFCVILLKSLHKQYISCQYRFFEIRNLLYQFPWKLLALVLSLGGYPNVVQDKYRERQATVNTYFEIQPSQLCAVEPQYC